MLLVSALDLLLSSFSGIVGAMRSLSSDNQMFMSWRTSSFDDGQVLALRVWPFNASVRITCPAFAPAIVSLCDSFLTFGLVLVLKPI